MATQRPLQKGKKARQGYNRVRTTLLPGGSKLIDPFLTSQRSAFWAEGVWRKGEWNVVKIVREDKFVSRNVLGSFFHISLRNIK